MARACCEYMKAHFHPTNCLAVRTFAESHNRVDLMDMADRYACEHFTEVVECEDFTCVSPQHLRTLLSSSELNIHSETQVYNAAVKWLKANPQHHEPWLDQIMSQVSPSILSLLFSYFLHFQTSSEVSCISIMLLKSICPLSSAGAPPSAPRGVSHWNGGQGRDDQR